MGSEKNIQKEAVSLDGDRTPMEFPVAAPMSYYLGNKYIAKIRISSFMVYKSTNSALQ